MSPHTIPVISDSNAARACRAGVVAAITSALAGGVAGPLAAAPGDLDPAFGDVGRTRPLPDFQGPAWTADVDGDDVIFAGGQSAVVCDYYSFYDYYCDEDGSGFVSGTDASGVPGEGFPTALFPDIAVFDVERLADGRIVGLGTAIRSSVRTLTVFRLSADGRLDAGFGDAGLVRVSLDQAGATSGSSLLVEPDGRIVVTGVAGNALLVARLLPNGDLDPSFGVGGMHVGTHSNPEGPRPLLLRTASGGYRVSTYSSIDGLRSGDCHVLALTAAGEVDTSFGAGGTARIGAAAMLGAVCHSMDLHENGRIAVAGEAANLGMVTQLMPDGTPDAGFSAIETTSGWLRATAVAAAGDGSLVVAARAPSDQSGAVAVRLRPDGTLDPGFGRNGSTWIDLPTDTDVAPVVHDIEMLPDGGVLLAGGATFANFQRPFLARLLGRGDVAAPGVIGMERHRILLSGLGEPVTVVARRIGGADGAVELEYHGFHGTSCGSWDYGDCKFEGSLAWADGDSGDRIIAINPLPAQTFTIALGVPTNGAGLGTNVSIGLPPDVSPPLGVLSIGENEVVVTEGRETVARVTLRRGLYTHGLVFVDLTTTAGSAVPFEDYAPGPWSTAWASGEGDSIEIVIPIQDDRRKESTESFTVTLAGWTPGAVVDSTAATATVVILDDDSKRGSSGGGRSGLGALLLLWVAGLIRWWRGAA